jgi:hypothetical protein
MHARNMAVGAVAVVVLAACGADTSPDSGSPAATNAASGTPTIGDGPGEPSVPSVATSVAVSAEPFAVDQIPSSPRSVTLSGLDVGRTGLVTSGLPEPLIDVAEVRSGGPPPDGIPPVDAPRFLDPDDVDFLADNEPVLALEVDGDARAYPVQVMTWHEIVNDTVGGIPVSVTYCPLCNSAVAYDRRVGDRVLDFGTSGLLWNSALVMYDRQTETLWSHFTGQGVIGELTGTQLEDFPLSTVAWSVWRDAHPEGLVLSRETGFDREYGRNPYPGYDDVDGVPFLFQGEVDGRYTALTRIVGVERDGAALGVPLVDLQLRHVTTGRVGETEIVVWWTPGTTSALDASDIAAGDDVGATGVFVPLVDGERLTFAVRDDATFTDDQTGSTWNVLGRAVDGPLAGTQLEPVSHVDTFWFAWSTFRPDTTMLTG